MQASDRAVLMAALFELPQQRQRHLWSVILVKISLLVLFLLSVLKSWLARHAYINE